MNINFNKIQSFRANVLEEIMARKQKEQNIFNHLAIKALEAAVERLNKIEKILKTPKYDLVFIGEVGAGKTTAICHLFNLVHEIEATKKEGTRDIKIIKTQELLSTGAGKTTICEVVIRASVEISIEIEPYSEQDLTELIEDFCEYFWLKTYPHLNEEGAQPPPAEQMRAIRNITGLNVVTAEKVSTDKALELAKSFKEEQFQDFYKESLSRANLTQRTETKILLTLSNNKDSDKEAKAWIQKTFAELNLAKLPNFSIPRKIYVNVDSSILDFDEFSRIGSIVDTRGMDTGQTRQDLASYIRDNDGAICLFTEKFPVAPTNVTPIIKMYLTRESQDMGSKFALFVMPRKNEPEKIVGADGPIEIRDEGIFLRKTDIEASFTGSNINFLSENILFYDALQFYFDDGRRDSTYQLSDISDERQRILKEIHTIISNRELSLLKEVEELRQNFEDIKNGRGLNAQDKQLIFEAKETIKGYRFLNFPSDTFVPKYINLWTPRYASTLRATNARFGVYEPRNIDVYYDAVPIAESIVREVMRSPKDKVMEAVEVIEQNASPESDLKPFIRNLKVQINSYHESLVEEIGETIMGLLRNNLLYPLDSTNQFWVDVQNRWGKGQGYKKDVLSMYEDHTKKVNNYLKEITQQLWQERLISRVIAFFG